MHEPSRKAVEQQAKAASERLTLVGKITLTILSIVSVVVASIYGLS